MTSMRNCRQRCFDTTRVSNPRELFGIDFNNHRNSHSSSGNSRICVMLLSFSLCMVLLNTGLFFPAIVRQGTDKQLISTDFSTVSLSCSKDISFSYDNSWEDWHKWTNDSLIYVQVPDNYLLQDGEDNSRSPCALYYMEDSAGIYVRVDVVDLNMYVEWERMDLFVMFDFATGGCSTLPNDVNAQTDSPYEVCMAYYNAQYRNIYTASGEIRNEAYLGSSIHAGYDSIFFGISKSLFTGMGYSNSSTMKLQVAISSNSSAKVGNAQTAILGTLPVCFPWDTGYVNGSVPVRKTNRTIDLGIFHHGNQFIRNVSDFIRDSTGYGFWKVPEIHERYGVPVNLHVSGTLAESAQFFRPDFNEYLKTLVSKGIVHMVGGYYCEYIPKYMPPELNNWSLQYGHYYNELYYGDNSTPICWIPERVFWDGFEEQVKANGYEGVMVDTEVTYRWHVSKNGTDPFWDDEGMYRLGEESNGLKVLFISNKGGSWAPENIQDRIHATTQDGGMNLEIRKKLLSMAVLPDAQDRYMLYMDDWEKTCGNIPRWGGHETVDAYESTIRWLSLHPWIQVKPLEELIKKRPAGTVNIGMGSYFWITQYWGEIKSYDAWYYDPLNEASKPSFFEFVPADTSMNMGDWKTPNTLVGETWKLVKQIPQTSPVYELAMKTFANMMYETAWHYGDLQSEIDYWMKDQAAHLRTACVYYYVHQWLSNTSKDIIASQDIDLDGQPEYILANTDIYCVFEKRGGKLVYAFDSAGRQVVGNNPAGWMLEGDALTDAKTDTTSNPIYDNGETGFEWAKGSKVFEGCKIYAFEDFGKENQHYDVNISQSARTLTFSYGGINKTFSLSAGGNISCAYTLSSGSTPANIRIAVLPDAHHIFRYGQANITMTGSISSGYLGWKNNATGALAYIYLNGPSLLTTRTYAMNFVAEFSLPSSTTINLRVSGTGTSAGSTIISLSQSSLALNNTLITSAIQITGTVQTTSGTISAVQFAIDASQNWLDANIAARRPSGSGEEADFAVLIDPSLLTPGNHTLLIRGRVSSGLYSGIISLNFRTEAGSSPNRPTLNIQSPQQGSVVSGTITVSGNASDPDNDLVKVEWAIDSTSPSAWNPVSGKTSWSFTIDTTKYTEGNHMIYVRATDAANLSNTSSLSLKFTKKEESSSSNRRVWILLGIVFLIALIVLVIGAIVRRQRGMKILASPQEQVETGPQTFVIENEKIICYACEIPLKKGDNAIKCTCNKVYHQKCANNIEECAFCSSPVSTKVKF